jgi:site-specific recombinase XerC
MTLRLLLHDFLTAKYAAGLSPRTIEWYRREVAALLNHLHHTDVSPGPEEVEAYLAMRRARGIQPATLAGHHRALRGLRTILWICNCEGVGCIYMASVAQ